MKRQYNAAALGQRARPAGLSRRPARDPSAASAQPTMMNDEKQPRPFQDLLREAQAGSPEAARELYDTYVAHVLRCVRNRMWHRLRSKFDSQDFVQQVWASFFVGDTKPPDFATPD